MIQIPTPGPILAPLTEAVRQGRALDATFFAIDPAIRFRVGTTPERLRKIYTVRSRTHETAQGYPKVNAFLTAMKGSRLAPLEDKERKARIGIDARLGFEVTDDAGRSLLWIGTNAEGDLAVIDFRVYRLSGPASAWFRNEGRRLLALKRREVGG